MRSPDVNLYVKEATGSDFSAKDFRTWNATVLAAVALAVSGNASSHKASITRAVKETAHYLGNTPAVCRASYIDPRVFDAYRGGEILDRTVIERALDGDDLPIHHRAIEDAVLALLADYSSG